MKISFLNLFSSLVESVSSFIFFQAIFGKKTKLPYYQIVFLFLGGFIVLDTILSVLNGTTTVYATIIRLSCSALLYLSLSFLFYSNIQTRLLVAISCPALIAVFEYFSYYIITSIFSYHAQKNVMDIFVFSNISLLASLFFFVFSILVHLIWKRQIFIHSLSYAVILLVIPAVSMCLMLTKPILYLNINLPSTYFLLAAFVLFINLMNYILLYNVLETEDLRFQLAVQKEQLTFQQNKYKQLGEAYKNIRSFMHDTKKHLFYIESCVNKKRFDDIIPYSRKIMHDLESRYCTINTGNLVIDAFVSNLLLQTKAQGITLHTNLKFDQTTVPVNDYHLTIILGNLLDNALNACKEQINAQITVAIRTVAGNFTVHVANTYVITDPQKMHDDFENIDFVHGYGLKNVKNSASTCGGFCVIQHENDIYSATVIVPISSPDKVLKF